MFSFFKIIESMLFISCLLYRLKCHMLFSAICPCSYVCKILFFSTVMFFHCRYINRCVCILNEYVIKLPKQFSHVLPERSVHSSVSHALYEALIPYNVLKLHTYLHCCALTCSDTVYGDWLSQSGLVEVSGNSGPKRHSGCSQINQYIVLRQDF